MAFGKNFTITDENKWENGGHIAEILEYQSKKLLFNFLHNKRNASFYFLKKESLI
jgi:hypothetical protein